MAFSDPIVAGNTLIRDAIESDPYVPGVTGWSINKDGSADFNDITVRGPVHVVGAEGEIEIVVTGVRPVMRFWNGAHNNYGFINVVDDTDPNAAKIGLNSGTTPSDNYPGITLRGLLYMTSADFSSRLGYMNEANQDPLGGQVLWSDITANLRTYDEANAVVVTVDQNAASGRLSFQASTDGTVANTRIIELGNYSGGFLHVQAEDWIAVAGANGWTRTVGTEGDYKLLPDGFVECRGRMNAGTLTAGTTIANFPAGYRPVRTSRGVAMSAGTAAWTWQITTAGALQIINAVTGALNLEQIRFSTV